MTLPSDTRAKHKHDIRKVFHKQLKAFWRHNRALADSQSRDDATGGLIAYSEGLAREFSRSGYRFAPLATDELGLFCGLDILFLRPDAPGTLIKSGDIDNRLKTLFDALRMPTGSHEIGSKDGPNHDEDPFFVLMEDDRLISKLSLETDMLLQPTGSEPNPNDCRLVITVTLRPVTPRATNIELF